MSETDENKYSYLGHHGINCHPLSNDRLSFPGLVTLINECSPCSPACQGVFFTCKEEIKHLPFTRNQYPRPSHADRHIHTSFTLSRCNQQRLVNA